MSGTMTKPDKASLDTMYEQVKRIRTQNVEDCVCTRLERPEDAKKSCTRASFTTSFDDECMSARMLLVTNACT